MEKIFGYAGKILNIDLEKQDYAVSELSRELITNYLGGKGLGVRILYDSLPAKLDPLSPENIIIFATGPLNGTPVPAASRTVACTKSPLTGLWLDSNAGGSFGPELKYAGYDALVIKGRAEKPTWISIEDDRIKFHPAHDLWGGDTFHTLARIKEKQGEEFKVLCIGPAGEKLAKIASIQTEYRSFGRGGAGAVMGSKNLKAIAVRGREGIAIYNREGFLREAREALKESQTDITDRVRYGTNAIYSFIRDVGVLPVMNFQRGSHPGMSEVDEDIIANKYFSRNKACFSCPLRCTNIALVKSGPFKGKFNEGPEYENTWSLGAQCGNTDIGAIVYGEHLCDKYGLDSISTGNVIGFTMECFQRGIIKERDLGFPLKFGDSQALIRTIELIGKQEGYGKFLGQGTRAMSRKLGGETPKFAMQVKGLELPAYDPRGSFAMGLAYATSDRGGCHLRSWAIGEEYEHFSAEEDVPYITRGKAKIVKEQQEFYAALDSMGLCLFFIFEVDGYESRLAKLLYTLTGLKEFNSPQKLYRIGERIYNLTRLFNVRDGISRKDDTLPTRILAEPLKEGEARGRTVDLEPMLKEYYALRGWDEDGIPGQEKLKELGLERR